MLKCLYQFLLYVFCTILPIVVHFLAVLIQFRPLKDAKFSRINSRYVTAIRETRVVTDPNESK